MSCQAIIVGLCYRLLVDAESWAHGGAEHFWNEESDFIQNRHGAGGNFMVQH